MMATGSGHAPAFGAFDIVRDAIESGLDAAFAGHRINRREYRVLRIIADTPDLLQREVAERAGIDRSNIGILIHRLLGLGLVGCRLKRCRRGTGHADALTPVRQHLLAQLAASIQDRECAFCNRLREALASLQLPTG